MEQQTDDRRTPYSVIDRSRTTEPSLSWKISGEMHRVVATGDLEQPMTSGLVQLAATAIAVRKCQVVEIDLAGVTLFGAAATRAVDEIEALCAHRGTRLRLVAPTPTTGRVLALFDLDRLTVPPTDGPEVSDRDDHRLVASRRFERVIAQGVLNGRDAVVVTTTDLDSPGPRIVFVNRAFTDLYGYAADEAIGETPRILQGPLTDRSILDEMKRRVSDGEMFAADLINYSADGEPFEMSWKVMPVVGPDGTPHNYMSMQSDVTADRRRARFELATSIVDTPLSVGEADGFQPVDAFERSVAALLIAQRTLLGGGVATIVLSTADGSLRWFTTAEGDDVAMVESLVDQYSSAPADGLVNESGDDAHLVIDANLEPIDRYVSALVILSHVHPDRFRLADPDSHRRLCQNAFLLRSADRDDPTGD